MHRSFSHLQYADDVILFSGNGEEGLRNLKRVLRCFSLVTGLKVNYHKSAIVGINQESQEVDDMAEKLLCRSEKLPIKYLGFPLGANPRRYSTWEGLIRRVRGRLAGWKGKFLSMGGRLTLVKSIVNSMPIFLMSLYKLPKKVIRELEMLMKRFIWKGRVDTRCLHKVKWEKLCLRREKGGAGVGCLEVRNKTLLLKWIWKLFNKPDSVWADLIHGRYGPALCGEGIRFKYPSVSKIWEDIMSCINDNTNLAAAVRENMKWELGRGNRIHFWSDVWLQGGALQSAFPRLYTLSLQKDQTVEQMGAWIDGCWQWDLKWRRELFEWEKEAVTELENGLSVVRVKRNNDDQIIWGNEAMEPSVKTCYRSLEDAFLQNLEMHTPNIWQRQGTTKSKCLLWLACQDRVLTKGRLFRLQLLRHEEMRCNACNAEEANADHVFIQCPAAQYCWIEIMRRWGTKGVLPNTLTDLILQWEGLAGDKKSKKIWDCFLMAGIWSVWLARNGRVFRGKEKGAKEVALEALAHAMDWARANLCGIAYRGSDLMAIDNWFQVLS